MGMTVKALDHFIVSARLFAVPDNSHLDALLGMPANGLINQPSSSHYATDYSFILTADGARLKLSN